MDNPKEISNPCVELDREILQSLKEYYTKLGKYIRLLEWHDWDYEYSDDFRVWQRGVDTRNEIQRLQQEIDVSKHIYNAFAPQKEETSFKT
jgi:hypothetical protein